MVLLQKSDELLDYKEAVGFFNPSQLRIQEGGSHAFDGIEHYFEEIKDLFQWVD